MNKIEFQKIMVALGDRINLCELQLGAIKTTDDISQLTISRATNLKSFCVSEEEIMTRIAMVDLYHIVGMAKLTPTQMMKFVYAIQEYLQYRPTIKAIAKSLNSIFELPKIPVETQYKLQGLGDLTLCSNIGAGDVDDASVEDYTNLKNKTNNLLPFIIEGRRIRVDMKQFDFFVTLVSNLIKSPLSADNFAKALIAHKEYLGIEWIDCANYEAIGYFKSDDMYKKLSGYYNGHK